MNMSNYVFGIHKFKSIPNDLFASLGGMPEENGISKKMSLVPDKGTPPDIFTTDRVVGAISLCGWQFSGQCNCKGYYSSNSSDCEHPSSECPVNVCTMYKCVLIIFEEEDPPPGTGTGPGSNGTTGWSNGASSPGGPLTTFANGSLPNAPCNNCAWFPEAPSYEFEEPLNNDEIVSNLVSHLPLEQAQIDWLKNNSLDATDIYDALQESLADENPATNTAYQYTYSPEAVAAAKMTIDAAINNLITGPYNSNHFATINIYLPQNNITTDPMYWFWFSINCALIKIEHPEYSQIRVYWEASKEMIHLTLDVVGLVPLFGEVADLANGIIYSIEGDGVNAGLSFAAMIPVAGWYSAGIKFAKKTINAVDGTSRTLKWLVKADGLIDFGDRSLLRKVLGLAKGDTRIAHHLVPWEHCTDDLIQKAAKGNDAFHMNEALNGIPLTAIQHNSGGHTLYNQKVKEKLIQLWNANGQDAMSNETAENLVRNLVNSVRNWIVTHPNQSINDIIL